MPAAQRARALAPAFQLEQPSCARRRSQQHRCRSGVVPRASGSGGDVRPPPAPAASDAVLERIRKAQQYKAGLSASKAAPQAAGAAPAAPAVQQQEQRQPSVDERFGAFAAQQAQRDAGAILQAQHAAAVAAAQQQQQTTAPGPDASTAGSSAPSPAEQRSFRTNTGDAADAASWLKTVASQGLTGSIDKSLSAEQFTLRKEELMRQQEVEIVTVDATYAARLREEKRRQRQAAEGEAGDTSEAGGDAGGPSSGAGEYRPAVATYGGGRNLRPGQPLESEEEEEARERRVSAALLGYRKAAGLEVDPASEHAAAALVVAGEALFREGLISAAVPKFQEAADLMPLRTRVGGEARLRHAICLDSLGRNEDAYAIYKQLKSHSAPGVAKQANRMLFGFKAAQTLKVESITYAPTSAEWKRYFDRVLQGSSALYVAKEGEEAADGAGASLAGALAAGIMLAPFAFVAYKVLVR
eukprot:scaffold15.g4211.t1